MSNWLQNMTDYITQSKEYEFLVKIHIIFTIFAYILLICGGLMAVLASLNSFSLNYTGSLFVILTGIEFAIIAMGVLSIRIFLTREVAISNGKKAKFWFGNKAIYTASALMVLVLVVQVALLYINSILT